MSIEYNSVLMVAELAPLIQELIATINDDDRATDDPDDDTPGFQFTVGSNREMDDWSYQTGDNSFTGGAYGFSYWGIAYLSRDTVPLDAAKEIADEIAELINQ